MRDLLRKYSSVFLVYDREVEDFADRLAAGEDIEATMAIEAGEDNKTLDLVEDICRFLLAVEADRDALILGVGGGTTTDAVGLAASLYKRGIHVAFVPTTLLAMVDAAYGGKNGVNLDACKNAIGSFLKPDFVYRDMSVLKTLPRREFLSGAAELLKTFLIADAVLYAKAVEVLSQKTAEPAELERLIDAAVAIKEDIVSKDYLDKGERHKLNLGHTFAHAIEWYERTNGVKSPMTHGEAVAVGIVQAARMGSEALATRIASDFTACGLPTALPYPLEDLWPAMLNDKKNNGGSIGYVVLEDIGKAKI